MIFIIFTLLGLIGCSYPSREQVYPDFMNGVYILHMQTDSSDMNFEIQLVSAHDSAVYGVIEAEQIGYKAPIGLDKIANDSLYFSTYTHELVISAIGDTMEGTFEFYNQNRAAALTLTKREILPGLLNSRDLIPVKTDVRFDDMGWAAPVSPDSIYFVSDRKIYLAIEEQRKWMIQTVNFDTLNWEMYSIGLSPQKDQLVAHGAPKNDSLPNLGGGDFYMLDLDSPTKIKGITHLPKPLNTESFEVFPSFSPNGDLLLSSWGVIPGITKAGSGDIFRAVRMGDTYTLSELDADINTPNPDAGASMSPDGKFLLFHRKDPEKGIPDQIFYSQNTDSGWTKAEKLGPPVFQDFIWTYAGRIDPTGEYLFFNSGFRGKLQIFRVPIADIPELSNIKN